MIPKRLKICIQHLTQWRNNRQESCYGRSYTLYLDFINSIYYASKTVSDKEDNFISVNFFQLVFFNILSKLSKEFFIIFPLVVSD